MTVNIDYVEKTKCERLLDMIINYINNPIEHSCYENYLIVNLLSKIN